MKELDKSKRYDLSKLTDEQLIELVKEVNKESKLCWFKAFKDTYLFFGKRSKTWLISDVKNKDIKYCATELFEDKKTTKLSNFPTKESCNKDLHKLINELEIALKFTKKKKSKIKVYEQLVEQLNKM